jgi:hypothetical protein
MEGERAVISSPARPATVLATFAAALTFAFAFAAAPAPADAAIALTRYPWINQLMPTSVLVTWRTDVASSGTVRYSEDLSYDQSATEAGPTTDHAVLITGLTDETLYFYKVESDGEELTTGDDYFITPSTSPTYPFLFAAFGDLGAATADQIAIASRIEALAPDFAILTGDIIYEAGEAANFDPQYFSIYRPTIARAPFYPSLGNHDIGTNNGQPYLDAFYLPTNSATGTERYYSFDYGNAHFVSLEVTQEDTAPDATMLTWLDQDLAASAKPWKFVTFHVPAYSNAGGQGGDATIAAAIEPILMNRGVDIVFQGHNHFYTRTYPLQSGSPVNTLQEPAYVNPSGPIWITTGGGGRALHPIVTPISSIEAIAISEFHVVEAAIVGNLLSLVTVDADDNLLDAMSITKTTPTAITMTGFLAIGEPEGVRLRWTRVDGGNDGGFHVDRALHEAGPWTRLTSALLRGESAFEFLDRDAEAGVEYVYRLTGYDDLGREVVTATLHGTRGAPLRFALERPRPNPARGATVVPFSLDRAALTRVSILDVNGRLVRTLTSRPLPAGPHTARWDGTDDAGRRVASGIYFAVVRSGDREARTRLALLR